MSDDQWNEGPLLPDDKDDDEYASEWAPVMMAVIAAGTIVLICLICGETVTSAVSIIWGKS